MIHLYSQEPMADGRVLQIKPVVETLCCFLRKIMTILWCSQVKRKAIAIFPVFLLFITCLAIPVSAFYFDFQYFETDKLVYEVGETIDMVAKLIADFSAEGWCYVSFAVVTDLGPSFADEYFISPSPLVRYLHSSYTILPEHTSPNITGVQSFALFTVEIFDTVSQSAGDNIEITINRGHLTTIPLSSLSVHYRLNTSLSLKIASVHNNNIGYPDALVTIHVENSDFQTVFHSNTTTTSEGIIDFNWSDSFGPPGFYNLTISSDGTEDFLAFTDSLQVSVLPALSNLTIVSSPESVYCQSPDESYFEQAEIIVEHIDLDSSPIDDSIIRWTTTFGSGILSNLGNGQYSNLIPFNTSPGVYQINLTATNPQFQTMNISTTVNVLANSLQFSTIQQYYNVTRGDTATIEFLIESNPNWNQSIQLQFTGETIQFSLTSDFQSNASSSILIPILHDISVGQHTINVSPVSEYYQFLAAPQINLIVIGTVDNISVNALAYYGETLEFNLELLDDNNQSVSWVDISILCDNGTIPFAFTGHVNSSITQTVSLPMWIVPGFHNFTFAISSQYFKSINYSMTVKVWMPTNITIIITTSDSELSYNIPLIEFLQDFLTTLKISSGSIMRPPPILLRETTSTIPPTARLTSLDN